MENFDLDCSVLWFETFANRIIEKYEIKNLFIYILYFQGIKVSKYTMKNINNFSKKEHCVHGGEDYVTYEEME